MNDHVTFIEHHRRRLGMSKAALAKRAGITRRTLYLVLDRTRPLTTYTALAIGKGLSLFQTDEAAAEHAQTMLNMQHEAQGRSW